MKKKLTQQQEFEVMKLVLDKFLWLGFIIMAYGLFKFFNLGMAVVWDSVILFITGAIVLLLFVFLIVREYEIIK